MCLYLRYKEECVATSNICVWKALINYGRFGYYSPIFNYRYNIKIVSPYAGRYECRGDIHNSFDIDESIDTIGLFIIPEGSHYYTDGYFYASDTLKLLRTLPKNKFFNYMMNR